VRAALQAGDFALAAALLGRPYTMGGRVVHGNKLGRTLGYPTVNIPVRRRRTPLHGIFAVRVLGVVSRPLPGVASLGTRPTVDGEGLLLEVHLFDFDGDLYGRRLEVEFVAWLRGEERFDTLAALERQMALDEARARQVLDAPVPLRRQRDR
jgi:riboflavin kinase/FMN adenylyltransferase